MEQKNDEKQVKKPIEKPVEKPVEKVVEKPVENDTYIMAVTHLSWGRNKMNHFYSAEKPVISKKVMGKYHTEIEIWLKEGWIRKGKY